MLALRHIGAAAIEVAFVLATAAIDSADARRGGGERAEARLGYWSGHGNSPTWGRNSTGVCNQLLVRGRTSPAHTELSSSAK